MTPCVGTYPDSYRPCDRPAQHEGEHGPIVTAYVRFAPVRQTSEYRGQRGPEVNAQRLTPAAYDDMAEARMSKRPVGLVVIGEWIREDGERFLDFGVPTAHIEAATDYRYHSDSKTLRVYCQSCDRWDQKHVKGCEAA